MSMAKCRECRAEVSSEAKACPKCGIGKPVRKTSAITKVVAGFFALTFGMALIAGIDSANDTPEEKAAKEALREAELAKVQPLIEAGRTARKLRDSMRDPASFELITAKDMGGGTQCFQYRARNGFGGMNVGFALSTPSGIYTENGDGFQARFKRECSGAGADVTRDAIRWMDR
jgi:hypothetical protein